MSRAILFSKFTDTVSKFRGKRSSLGELVFELQPIVENIPVASSRERDELRGLWAVLDEVYAVALDESRDPIQAETDSVLRSLGQLETFVAEIRARQE